MSGLLDALDTGIVVKFGSDITGLVKGIGTASGELEKFGSSSVKSTVSYAKLGVVAAGVATTTGLAIVGLTDAARETNAKLAGTAITLGTTTEAMRDLALATSDAGFPLDDTIATFDLLARAGVRGDDQLQSIAKTMDTLGDATGNSAATVTSGLIPAMNAFDIPLSNVSDHMDGLTYLTKNSTIDLTDFLGTVSSLGPKLDSMGVSLEDTEGIMLALADVGYQGTAATKRLRSAITELESAEKAVVQAQQDALDTQDKLTNAKKDLTKLEQEYADALVKAGDTSKEVAELEKDYTKEIAKSKKNLIELEEDYNKALQKIQDTTKEVAKLDKDRAKELAEQAKEAAKLEAEYNKEKVKLGKETNKELSDLDAEYQQSLLDTGGNPEKQDAITAKYLEKKAAIQEAAAERLAAIEERYQEKKDALAERAIEQQERYNDRLMEIKDTSEAVAALNERYAEQKEAAQERINQQTVDYNERLLGIKDTTEAVSAVNERYADRISNAKDQVATLTGDLTGYQEASVTSTSKTNDLYAALGLTKDQVAAYTDKIKGAKGDTEKYASAAETSIGTTDRMKSSWDEMTLSLGSSLEPLSGVSTAFSIGGPLLLGLTQLPMLIGGVNTAMLFMAANPIVLVIAAVAALVLGLYYLETKFHWIEALMSGLGDAFAVIWAGIGYTVQGAADLITGAVQVLMSGISWAFNNIIGPIQGAWSGLWSGIQSTVSNTANFISGIVNGIMNGIKSTLNIGIDAINTLIRGINTISFTAPDWLGGGSIGFNIAQIPRLASGGIVTKPTIAMIGEAGPEAVVPLSGNGSGAGMGGITIRVDQMNVRNDQDIKLIAQELQTLITRTNRGRGIS